MAARAKVARVDVAVGTRTAAAAADSWPVRLLGAASELADQPPLIALCTASLVGGLALGDRRLANAGGRMLAAELVATLMKSAVKANVDRTRPYVVAKGGQHRLQAGHSDESALNSFPSGHTAGAVAVARAAARSYPEGAPGAALAAAAAALIQVPRGKHYPLDVAAGVVIGLAAEALVAAAERRLVRATR